MQRKIRTTIASRRRADKTKRALTITSSAKVVQTHEGGRDKRRSELRSRHEWDALAVPCGASAARALAPTAYELPSNRVLERKVIDEGERVSPDRASPLSFDKMPDDKVGCIARGGA